MKTNRIVIGDTMYMIDVAYRKGAHAYRDGISWRANPYNTLSDRHSQWEAGHEHESGGAHNVNGIDVTTAKQNGTIFTVEN